MTDTHDRSYRPDIDGLRALAVVAVVAYHAFPGRVPGGFVGVDVFFVISGFLITSIIQRSIDAGRFSFAEFYARRVRRIFPALGVVLAFCLVAGWFELWTSEFKQLGQHVMAAVGFVSNVVLYREAGYFDAASETKPLLHLWSLGIEEQYYLVWPLLLWGLAKLRRGVAVPTVAVLAASFALNVWWVRHDPSAAFFLPMARVWELMIGGALAIATLRGRVTSDPRWGTAASLLGLAAILGAVALLSPDRAFPGFWALLPTLGTALVIAAGPGAWANRRVLSPRPVVFVGLISYPLYLWHWPLLTFARIGASGTLSSRAALVVVAVSVVCAWLTYQFVELRVRGARARRLAPALAGGLALVGVAGVAISTVDGVPWRFPASVRRIDDYALASPAISREWRRHRCMLETEGTFADECVEREPAAAPLVVLWGDSHAAALYPGLHAEQARLGFRVAQFSTSRCPPIVGFVSANPKLRNEHCVDVNDRVLARIAELRPSAVILTAYWDIYEPDLLPRTMERLRALGVRRVVVGNVPVWRGNPARALFHAYRRDPSGDVPSRMSRAQFKVPVRSDSAIAGIAASAGAEFVSLLDVLCDRGTCTATTDGGMTYSNADHLAPPGARAVVARTLRGVLASVAGGVLAAH